MSYDEKYVTIPKDDYDRAIAILNAATCYSVVKLLKGVPHETALHVEPDSLDGTAGDA